MMYRALVLVFSLGILQSSAQILQNGQCDPNIALMANFNLQQFLGTWYEVARSSNPNQGADCAYHQFDSNTDTNTNTYYNRGVNKNFLEEISGTVVSDNDNTARLILNLISGAVTSEVDVSILLTDYFNYAVGYRCENVGTTQRNVYIWQLGRTTTPAELITAMIGVQLANLLGVNIAELERLDHSDEACYILPVIDSNEAVILPGQCDLNMTVVQNFDVTAFTGVWHEIASYYSESALGACSRAQYTLQDGVVDVVNSHVIDQTLLTISGNATVTSTDGSGRVLVTLEVQPGLFSQQELLIIATDYSNYAISYSCENIDNNNKRVYSWLVGRQRQLSATAQSAVNAVVDSIIDLNQAYYAEANRTDEDCFYYPDHVPGQTVSFRGQCDLNIPAMPNFDPGRYMGLWHDIESYPSTFQQGTCNNAFYTLVDGVVDVYNTQVVNQTLDYINGYAVLASDDGSAKLLVTFPVVGTNFTATLNYWVLDTDYETYALVYTCENIDDESRRVFSWKLSRTKQLTAAANTIINNITSTIPVLDDRYYENKDQSVEACFYYPEAQAGVPVVFPGQCDETVAVVNNFNLTQFLGTWHEIEAYPKEEQGGQCINHQYTAATANTLSLQSSSVVDQFLQLSNSTVAFSSTDGSAKLVITLVNSDGTQIQIPFWILNTDYTDYALAYSCINLNNDFRGIYSWKLSRSKELSAAANTLINNAISTNVVLDNVYFESIDQSDDACFYLPELAAGEAVILPGQCDPDIAVVQNFNADAYQGLWHLIESYPSTFQYGDCNDATYTIQADGTVLVYNTQVTNQTLYTITGSATLATTDGSAKFIVTFPNAPASTEYWVLDTDYTSYSVVYSCVNINTEQRQVWSWKMGRSKTLSENATNSINQVINSVNVLNNRYFETIDNTDSACFYFPEADGNPVIFRGQCDENIPVVTNFDAVAYMGLWHDAQSYPSTFQGGSCNNAFYTLVDGTVDVYNTQVINQTLDTINGVAVLATTDGTAKLLVTFPIAGTNLTTETPYWVLATDYTSYSLVYTCINIDTDYRQVWSWKLSRSKELATASATEINAVTNTIPVLDDRYYQEKDQSADGCFYYPEPQDGVPVVFPGQCEGNVSVVANFNLEQFVGTWYEIQAYPKNEQSGQCINHQYTQGTGNTLDLQSYSVIDTALSISNSSLSFTSTDGSAQLLITLTSTDGTIVTIPFWILSTDYNDYALAYSCVNLDDDYRAVYSWKLSRSKSLSTNADTIINSAISTVSVLDNVYYENINQSDDACFYLPELSSNEPVVFVGQCDSNIQTVQNFDAQRFAGRWFDIESYFDEYTGDCIDSTFNQSGNGFDVLLTQVVNQTLDSTYSTASVAVDGSGKLNVTANNVISEYWILATDYDSYALIYSCNNLNDDSRRVRSWKMSRSRQLTEAANVAINNYVNDINVLNDRYFIVKDHSDAACFYLPDFVPGQTVTFRGQCDENLAVVQNFDVDRYLGLWYDIQSYPQEFQDSGSCATATYTLGANGVDVYNTQVVDQLLDTINGTAVVNSTDGSAKLLVTFSIPGTTYTFSTPYWVLATDYDSYSLVYSCSNIDTEYRRVTVWKLSREQTLSAAASTAISNVVNNVDVLDERYFQETGHTADDCFFYPNNFGGPVIQNGQCPPDSEVDVVTNFSAAAFDGTWHEISRFPNELQTGECAAHNLNLTGTSSFSLTQTFIYDERLNTAIGSAAASADGRGILAVSLTGTGGTTDFNLYILDTDYTEFALAYGCINLSTTTKQIYSWKLSRTRAGLSQAANDRIDQAVTNHTDLHPIYYEDTDQSDYGCFYYPQYDTLPELIVLPGPCNSTIPAKANLNAAAYLGRWFEVAKFPDPNQSGTCSRAEYSLGNNVVDVYNTQVINSTLDIQTGFAVVSSVDGSGLLSVTFDVNGVTFVEDYYVLETDYTSFSLVYSCRNTTDGNRQVTSWKLSRNPTLTNESLAIIDTFIDNTQGLSEEYFTPTSQSDEDCFYVPEVDVNSAPVFRGACQNVTGVANFNVEQYVGWWHEIERYPVDQTVGECISSQYEQSETGYVVVETNVIGDSADVSSAIVVVSEDGRVINIYSDGRVKEFWVLATDYQTYSLLYSCETFIGANDDVYRRVWSAKHSKTRQLTAAAQIAMNPVIEVNELLYPQFYQQVAQDDSACFYYPELTGSSVILPGQCDENIPTTQNFDVYAYTGTWYLVERYLHPNILDAATCIGSRYTVSSDDEISVLSWVVVGGELVSVEGSAVLDDVNGGLIVTLPTSNNETVSVVTRILDTDYATYSLVYTCENVNEFQRSVSAFKLSRTRYLPDSAATFINSYMAQREELHQPYFTAVTQNDDCEEPSSGFLAKSSIVLVLACALLQMMF